MKKLIAVCSGMLLLASPAFALADNGLTPVQTEVRQLTTVVAALEAQEAAVGGQSIACAALMSTSTVKTNEPFFLAWGSVGAMSPGDDPSRSMWPQNGSSIMSVEHPGTWTYSFTFYEKSGATASCSAKIVVTQ